MSLTEICLIYSETKSNAQAGLVNGSDFYTLPGSGTENITLLNVTSNVGQQGSWFFRLHSFLPACMLLISTHHFIFQCL